MNVKFYLPGLLLSITLLSVCSCQEGKKPEQTKFTKVDSLTDTYLTLKDSMLHTWNAMINDDNQKIRAMNNLLHELKVSNPSKLDEMNSFQQRLDRLAHSRYTQKSMENVDVIEEYDFASNSLVTELISMAEAQTQFAYNTTLQKLVETIRVADQRTSNYRAEYDRIAMQYNAFIEVNRKWMTEIDPDSFMQKKPLFQMVAEDDQE